ncbi:MAG: extracellular solute-binding protein [Clostridium sp.]|nr:extracellular solute-binding protein [Clostridium sp.]
MRQKIFAGIFIFILLFGCLAGCGIQKEQEQPVSVPKDYKGLMSYWQGRTVLKELTCWYTNDEDKAWLETVAGDFEKEYGAKVNLVYYDGVSLFDDMNQANQKGSAPDVYLAGNDQIELAVLSGMASENTWLADSFWQEYYPDTAKKAVTYKGRQYGYPVYFDTYCLVYDANLLPNAPASIEDILNFADEYEDTGSTKAIFRWDVADPYINTMFLASYAELFGENGDDSEAFKVNDEKCIEAMEYFQSLSAYLWMNKNNISHDTIKNRIREGTLVLGLCKSDILPVLYEMQDGNTENGAENAEETDQEETDYRISYVPSLTDVLSTTTLSTTYGAFVNPYGADTNLGNLFALYLSVGAADKQYAGNGRLPVVNGEQETDSLQSVIYAQYLNSEPVPKVMALGDYLSEGGIAFDAIWGGADVKEQLDRLQKTMKNE